MIEAHSLHRAPALHARHADPATFEPGGAAPHGLDRGGVFDRRAQGSRDRAPMSGGRTAFQGPGCAVRTSSALAGRLSERGWPGVAGGAG